MTENCYHPQKIDTGVSACLIVDEDTVITVQKEKNGQIRIKNSINTGKESNQ